MAKIMINTSSQPKPKPLFLTNRAAYVDSVLNANKHLDWVKRLYEKNAPSIQVPDEPDRSTHLMGDDGQGYVFPTIVRINGALKYLGDNAEDYARETNTGIQLPKQEGTWFANNGYKTGINVNNSINPLGVPYNIPNTQVDDKGNVIYPNKKVMLKIKK